MRVAVADRSPRTAYGWCLPLANFWIPNNGKELASICQVPVANGYGSREAGFIAHDCPAGSMHITDENVIVEITDADGQPVAQWAMWRNRGDPPGHTRNAPDRYRTGDMGRRLADRCSCGRGLGRLDVVGGRITDHVVASDGTVLHGLSVIYVLREIPTVEQFQIRQHEPGAVQVLIVGGPAFTVADRKRIENGLADLSGG